MTRLAQTADLTDIQQEILSTVRTFVDKEIIPHAQELEHADAYPTEIVDGLELLRVRDDLLVDEGPDRRQDLLLDVGQVGGLRQTGHRVAPPGTPVSVGYR